MVMSGRSVNLITLFLGKIRPPKYLMHIVSPVTDNCPSRISGRRNESRPWPDRVSNPGPLTLELDVLLTALCGPAVQGRRDMLALSNQLQHRN